MCARRRLGLATLVGVVICVVSLLLVLLHEVPSPFLSTFGVLIIEVIHRLPQSPVRWNVVVRVWVGRHDLFSLLLRRRAPDGAFQVCLFPRQ